MNRSKSILAFSVTAVVTNLDEESNNKLSGKGKLPLKLDTTKWTKEEFQNTFQQTNTPALLANSIDSWEARSWNWENLPDKFPQNKFTVILDDKKEKFKYLTLKVSK